MIIYDVKQPKLPAGIEQAHPHHVTYTVRELSRDHVTREVWIVWANRFFRMFRFKEPVQATDSVLTWQPLRAVTFPNN